jgi:hypothetical protein
VERCVGSCRSSLATMAGERRRRDRPPWKAIKPARIVSKKSSRAEARCWLVRNWRARVGLRSLRRVRVIWCRPAAFGVCRSRERMGLGTENVWAWSVGKQNVSDKRISFFFWQKRSANRHFLVLHTE